LTRQSQPKVQCCYF